MRPTALIIRAAGTNCDQELAHAFELAGACSRVVHLNRLIEDPQPIDSASLIGFPGGFSYGDDIAAGRIFATRIRRYLLDSLIAAVSRGVPMIGICNGFQVLVQSGLLPRLHKEDSGQDQVGQVVALADNERGRFLDRWVGVSVPQETVCIWTRGLDDNRALSQEAMQLPIAHGEGRFVTADEQVVKLLQQRGQVALRYDNGGEENPNGSVDDIAGICDPSGVVLGLMPHPERYTDNTHHPHWTRTPTRTGDHKPSGLVMFENAVSHATRAAGVS